MHVIATPRPGFRVVAPDSARWLWTHLQRAFPNALACCLMPDHVHLLLPAGADADKLQRILAQHGRIFGTRWTTHHQPATTAKIAWRAVRYILWNPVRAKLVDDPWSWPWSTLRDLGGVIVHPWTIDPIRHAARRVGVARTQVLPQLTTFEGAQPPLPTPADFEHPPVTTLERMAAAVASSLRASPRDIARRGDARTLFVHLATTCGRVSKAALADACEVRGRSIYRLLDQPTPPALRSALRCLQDPRLRIHDVEPPQIPTPSRRAGASR